MKITYLYHSGFAVEMDRHILLFDYFKGNLPVWDQDKELLVFASHKHHDHFNLQIFDLAGQYSKVHFFLGSDIRLSDSYLERNGVPQDARKKLTNIGKNRELDWKDVKIRTLRSTDAGVAFIVEAEGKRLYHAGDLNWWHWEGEPSPWNENMERDYKEQILKLQGMHFDAAFVPLDPRLGDAYSYGMQYFLENTDSELVFPMHMWDEYGWIEKYKESAGGRMFCDKIMNIASAGQEFELWNTD